jgi:hypothetical protein
MNIDYMYVYIHYHLNECGQKKVARNNYILGWRDYYCLFILDYKFVFG